MACTQGAGRTSGSPCFCAEDHLLAQLAVVKGRAVAEFMRARGFGGVGLAASDHLVGVVQSRPAWLMGGGLYLEEASALIGASFVAGF